MEKIFYIVLLFVFNIPISYSQSSWFWLNPTPQGRELNKIELINNGFGVAAGINGSMIRSSNGGNNWININTNFNLNFRSITFVDESLGFAVEGSQVLKTTDGGYNWSQLYYEPPNSLQDILFINSKTGFICGEYFVAPVYYFGTVSKTTNGGISWFHPTLPLFLSPITSLSILDSLTGYAVGAKGISTTSKIKTTDGGNTWFSINNVNYSYFISMINETTGFALGNNGLVEKTSDGGMSWVTLQTNIVESLNSCFFTNINTGYVVGNSGIISKTTNSGINWEVQSTGTNERLRSISFIDDLTGFVVGQYGIILKTTNSGLNWINQREGVTDNISSIQFSNSNTGYCASTNGKVLKTILSGNVWEIVYNDTNNSFESVSFPTNDTGYVCGNSGVVIKTNNGGISWIQLNLGTSINLKSSYFLNSTVGFLAGDSINQFAKIYITTDGGSNWRNQLTNDFNDKLNFIIFHDFAHGFACSVNGKILRTTNSGNNWTYSTVSGNISSLFMINSSNGFATTNFFNGGKILKTSNGGIFWSSINLPYVNLLESIFFVNENTGFAAGKFLYGYSAITEIYKTTNSGSNWYITNFSGSHALNSIFFSNETTGYLAGEGGLILKTTDGGGVISSVSYNSTYTPNHFFLHQNYPNPFNPDTRIKFLIPKSTFVRLTIYDITGRKVDGLINDFKNAGEYEILWNASNFSSGIYFYKLETSEFTQTKKLLLIR